MRGDRIIRVGEPFDPDDFRSKDGAPTPTEVVPRLEALWRALSTFLAWVRDPRGGNLPEATITVLSGYRSPKHNRKVGGAKNSRHVIGDAADITVAGATPAQVHAWLDRMQRGGTIPAGGLGLYKTWVHVDLRGERARWKG